MAVADRAGVHGRCGLELVLVAQLALFARGLLYVALQSAFVVALAAHSIVGAFALGSAISYVWTGNVIAQHGLSRLDRAIYACGAGTGAVLGMVGGTWLAWLWSVCSLWRS